VLYIEKDIKLITLGCVEIAGKVCFNYYTKKCSRFKLYRRANNVVGWSHNFIC